ncbi:NAD(P)/FAD-dependent oxidoreductase [Rubrivirga sp. IMCC43871]|uniref:type III sulfide quinone reductase, selenoprotein subtype n=1 Tax=Rubrivirga sp. IMCC43871 TaxID=3391575 RepID=UPI00399018C9
MRSLVLLGAGTAGTMMLNKLRRALPPDEWRLTIVDRDDQHLYQPGLLFIPFGEYTPEQVVRSRQDFFPGGIEFVVGEIDRVDVEAQTVALAGGQSLDYDVLIVATGTAPYPEETPGLVSDLWYRDAFDFYTLDGAVALRDRLETWEGGRLVINLAESVFKCPVAPLEFAFLADAYLEERGLRDRVEIVYATPLAGAFTKPKATEMLSRLLKEKQITVVPDFYLECVDSERKTLVAYDGREEAFDLLVSVPVNMGAAWVEASGLGDDDDLRYIPTDRHTLQAKAANNVFVLGDATNLPTSKAGSVAHFEAEVLTENVLSFIAGEPLVASFDGHANCFIETGHGKATLIDFNYDTEPLPGRFPLPVIGPMSLLGETRLNHLGKLAFKWVYWHLLLTGKELPVSSELSMAGKVVDEPVAEPA